jgi:DNA polymerase-1
MQLPLFEPKSNWRPPAVLPELDSIISLDVETYDPYLTTTGPSFKRGEGKVVGIALADKNTHLYLPIAHQGGDNLDKRIVISYVKHVLQTAKEVIMANALYDLGWLDTLGLSVSCPVRDIQVAEALLDQEKDTYKLDALAYEYLGQGKQESQLNYAAGEYAVANKGFNPKADLWKLPARHVGKYAEYDARYTYDIYLKQIPKLEKEGLNKVWELECEVTKALTYMTKKGVPVDKEAAEKLRDDLYREEKRLKQKFGDIDIWSSTQLGEYLTRKGVRVKKTEKGNYSVTKEFLNSSTNDICSELNELRGINRLRKVFVEDIALNSSFRGRIHADYRQITSDEGGTRSGRLSSSKPNMQQVPKRSKWGKRIRQLYVSEPDTLWCKADYSSQEPRLQVHYGILEKLPKSKEAAEAFTKGIKFYTFFEEVTGLPYDVCKMLCLGISYGMGMPTMANKINMSEEECSLTLNQFNAKAPFLRKLFERTAAAAKDRGYIKTILGRKSYFNQWSPGFDLPIYKTKASAFLEYPNHRIERAFTNKAFNRLIQGSAADQSKLALVECFKSGFDIRLPVHDEINAMVQTEQEAKKLGEIMENVIQLKVPSVADLDIGRTWC